MSSSTHISAVPAWLTLVFVGGLILPRVGYLAWRLWRYGEQPKNYAKEYYPSYSDVWRMAPTGVVSLVFLVICIDVDYLCSAAPSWAWPWAY